MSYHAYDQATSQAYQQPNSYRYSRPPLDPPRPLEPRPALYSSRSDTAATHRSSDAFRSPLLPDTRSQFQSLPGLKDILVDSPDRLGHSVRNSWDRQGQHDPYRHSNDTRTQQAAVHPPMTLQPPHGGNPQARPPAFEVPILETTPVNRHVPPPLAHSPYAGFPEAARDNVDSRSDGGYRNRPAAFTSPEYRNHHAVSGPDDRYAASAAPTFRRPSVASIVQAGAESQTHYLGTQEIPGEGSFHVWEGGYRMPTHVDGEQVNPAWGLTKANKPRKRLALACLDCREKKIKCEPGGQSCLQCEKAKRPCRRAPGQVSQSSTPVASWQDSCSPVRKNPSTSDPTPSQDRATDLDPNNKRRSRADPSPPNVPSKKHRSSSPDTGAPDAFQYIKASPRIQQEASLAGNGPAPSSFVTLEDDPYEVDPDLTLHLVELYFSHINSAVYWLYPRQHFLNWLKTAPNRCQKEKMVLHALLGAASVFAKDGAASFGRQCARVASLAIKDQAGMHNITAAHTRMLLALYEFAKGKSELSWDYVGSATRTVTFLGLNIEEGCVDDTRSSTHARLEFGFTFTQLAECKRRTFWSCFLMDRFNGPRSCSIKPGDIFLRLPCSDALYEQGTACESPYFPNDFLDPIQTLLTPASQVAPMAWLALSASHLGEVIDFVSQIQRRHSAGYRECYERSYQELRNKLQGWCSRLPPAFQYSEENLRNSIQVGHFEALIAMHSVYHMAYMKLNQCLRHQEMPDMVSRNIREALYHAQEHLRMMGAVQRNIERDCAEGHQTILSLATPFSGYVTLTAINIVSAGGPESTLQPTLELIDGGLLCLHSLSSFWDSASEQLRICRKRYYEVKNTLTSGQNSRSGAWLGRHWGLDKSMEQYADKAFRQTDDCIYGLGDQALQMYFGAFTDENDSRRGQQRGLRIG